MTFSMYDIYMGTNGYPGPGVMQTVPTLMDMTRDGFKVDPVARRAWLDKLYAELKTEEVAWASTFAPTSPSSTFQLRKLMHDEWEFPVYRSKHDGITIDELALVNYKQLVVERGKDAKPKWRWQTDPRCTPDVFDLLLRIRGVSKSIQTYGEVKVHDDGRIHPGYLPESKDSETNDNSKRKGLAATGRLASRDPNIQNQPKLARKMFIADTPNMWIVQHDYTSAELYVTAEVSGDVVLKEDLRVGKIHARNAERFNCDKRAAKAVIYGTNYGAGPKKISDTLKLDNVFIPEAECKRIQNGIAKTYSVMWAWRQVIASMCVNEGCVANPMGRVRYYYNGAGDITSAYDFVPQSTVADILWCVLRDVGRCAKRHGGRLLTTVHDSIVAQIPDGNQFAYAVETKAIMERRFDCVGPGFFIPVGVEFAKPGMSWGDLEEMEFENAA